MHQIAAIDPDYVTKMAEHKKTLLIVLAVWQIGFILLAFVYCILFSHRVAGPIYNLTQYLSRYRKDGRQGPVIFRKHDYFKELADEMNLTMNHIHETQLQDFALLDEVANNISNIIHLIPNENKSKVTELQATVDNIRNRYKLHNDK